MRTRVALQILLAMLIILDILTLGPWIILILSLVGIIPAVLTIWLLILHIYSLVSIQKNQFISQIFIRQQVIAGTLLIIVVSYTITALDSLSTLSTPVYSSLASQIFIFLTSALVCSIPLVLVLLLNKKLKSSHPPITPSQEEYKPPVSPTTGIDH